MYPSPQFREDIESAPVLIAELIKAWTGRQQLRGTEKKAPPHRFCELLLTGAVSPKPWGVLDDPEPVTKREVMRVDIPCITPATCQ